MSDKTIEEAAERNAFENHEELSKALLHAASHWQVDMYSWQNLLNEINGICATIAQLREENERLKGVMEQASGHLTNLQLHIEQLERRHRLFIDTHVDMAMEVMSQALTPKLPKTNG